MKIINSQIFIDFFSQPERANYSYYRITFKSKKRLSAIGSLVSFFTISFIQPIIALSEVLRSRTKDADEHEFLDVIIRSAKRLQQLTDNILNLAQIENHSLRLSKERFDLSALITNIQDYRNQLTRKNDSNNNCNDKGDGKVKLLYTNGHGKGDHRSKDDIIFVEADVGRITQVISNLLNNAIKFTKLEVVEVKDNTITIMVDYKDDKSVLVSVEDTGRGIDPEILPKLFLKFVTNQISSF